MKFGRCDKCGKRMWLEIHHVYPQAIFKGEGNKVYLCPDCHTDLHLKMGKIKSKDKGFYESFHLSWIWGIIILVVVICLTIIF